MKRLSMAIGLLAISFSLPAFGAESAAGGLEFSGNASILTGWQHDSSGSLPLIGGEFALERGPMAPNRDTFQFYLDQIELDLDKSFGEKIRLRADLDFGRALSGSIRATEGSNFIVEQAYVTVGILGGEFAIGRFNAPVGYYVVDRAFNPTISFSNIYNYITPTNVTGAKMYWAFNDTIDLSVYLMNNMFDCLQLGGACQVGPRIPVPVAPQNTNFPNQGAAPALGLSNEDSAIPSWGMRVGFNFGEGDKKSTVGLSYMGGPEQSTNAHLDHLLDLDFALKPTENLLLAGEFIYYQRNNLPGILGPNEKFIGGLLVLDWQASDIWDIFFSYGYVQDFQGLVTGAKDQIHNFVLGFGYQITDGAKFKMEYRGDMFLYAAFPGGASPNGQAVFSPGPGGDTTSMSNAVAAEFAYVF